MCLKLKNFSKLKFLYKFQNVESIDLTIVCWCQQYDFTSKMTNHNYNNNNIITANFIT